MERQKIGPYTGSLVESSLNFQKFTKWRLDRCQSEVSFMLQLRSVFKFMFTLSLSLVCVLASASVVFWSPCQRESHLMEKLRERGIDPNIPKSECVSASKNDILYIYVL